MIRKYTTEARPAPKNEIWEQEIDGQRCITERPYYQFKKLEIELFSEGFRNESQLLFGNVLPFFFDEQGRWWAHPALCSQEMLTPFIREPLRYLRVVCHKVQAVKRVIATLREIEPKLSLADVPTLREHFTRLTEAFVGLYSSHFMTFIVFDELVLRFRKLLERFLPRNKANRYFSEFLQAEITKEAIAAGAVEETTKLSRDIFYSDARPIIFYREPKLFFDFKEDNDVIAQLAASSPSPEVLQEFFALRLITPISIQLSEEAQYVESKMFMPMLRITLEKISTLLKEKKLIGESSDIRDFSTQEILEKLHSLEALQRKKVVARGMGVSKGVVHGRVRIITNMDDHQKFGQGDILVTRITDPTMVLLMGKAAGIICDIGGMVSHPSILSREMGVPCVVSARCTETGKPVTEVLRDGMLVEMCGSTGVIHAIDEHRVD